MFNRLFVHIHGQSTSGDAADATGEIGSSGRARPLNAAELIRRASDDAIAAYGRCGLPTVRGEYCREPGAETWTWIAPRLTPEEKWSLVEDQPVSAGWAYCAFAELGRRDENSTLANLASAMLTACDRLQNPGALVPAALVETAIQLGVDWQRLIDADPEIRLVSAAIAPPRPNATRSPSGMEQTADFSE